ncbi:MAG: accessory factor UbiK family protein [Formosimonas sp.]
MNQWQNTIEQVLNSSPLKDVGQNAKTFLVSALRQLDVVSREEFDIQAAMLARTRERLEALEARVSELERCNNAS